MTQENSYMNAAQTASETLPEIKVIKITDGLGFGTGSIAVGTRMESGADSLNEVMLAQVDSIIESPQILIAVDVDSNGIQIEDDGCGDGRGVNGVWQSGVLKKRSLNRPKVFGGGVTMSVAASLANGEAASLEDLFTTAIDSMDARGIAFGAHTDGHAHGNNCGCGAIDRAPEIVQNVIEFKPQIMAAIEAITGIPSIDNPALNKAYERYEAYATANHDQSYSGAHVMDEIVNSGKIVKELAGDHKEVRVVINTVPNYTVNQGIVRDSTNGEAQVFAVDEWRLKELSEKLYETQEEQILAYTGMLVYTLATAGTLTSGDLPVYAVTN